VPEEEAERRLTAAELFCLCREATPRRDGEQDLQRRRPADQMLGLVRLNRKTEPNKPKPNASVSSSLTNRSIVIAWKPNIFETEQTEPICRFKPNAQAEFFRARLVFVNCIG